MRWTRRLAPLPPDVRAGLPLERSERVLAHALVAGGGYAVATDRALLLPVPAGGHERAPWWQVVHAGWDHADQAMTVDVEAARPDGRPVRHRLRLDEPGFLPETVRERVTASIAVSQHVPLVGRAGVRLVGRRQPGSEGELHWQVVFDPGLDPADPGLRRRADAALTRMRAATAG